MSMDRLLIGRVLADRYRVASILGRGGMGTVYRAQDAVLDREVAVKVMHDPHDETAAMYRARFRREAQTAARLQHPNIITIHDFGVDRELDLPFLVMELLAGRDLQALVADEGRQPPGVVGAVLRQAAEGLAAGHAAGVVHRDIKPSNVFVVGPLAPSGLRVVLLDFGIARVESGAQTQSMLTRPGQKPHSPGYASPEQLAGDPLTQATDVYSLAATGWFLLTGESPTARRETPRGQPTPPPARWPGDGALRELLVRCLHPDPARRPPDARAFARELEALDRAPAPPPEPEPVRRPAAAPNREWTRPAGPSAGPARAAPKRPAASGRRKLSPLVVAVPVALAAGVTTLLAFNGFTGDDGARDATTFPAAPPSILPLAADTAPLPTEAREPVRQPAPERETAPVQVRAPEPAPERVPPPRSAAAVRDEDSGREPSRDDDRAAARRTEAPATPRPVEAPRPAPVPRPVETAHWKPDKTPSRWSGTYYCRQGLTGMTLVLTKFPNGRVEGMAEFYAVRSNPGVPSGRYSVRGTLSPDGRLALQPVRWIVRPDGYFMAGMRGTIDSDGSVYSGEISNATCGRFELRRVSDR